MKIGAFQIKSPFFLAPMAGYTCSSMRRVCIAHGAGLVATEMAVAMHLVRAPKETMHLLHYDEPTEHPIVAQLATWDVESAGEATRIIAQLGFDGVDLNLGCSVRRMVSGGMGSALAGNPKRLRAVLDAMVKATDLPVTAKLRSGPDAETETAPEVAKLCEDCGVSAVAVHGRHAGQAYRGTADWNASERVLSRYQAMIDDISGADLRRWQEQAAGLEQAPVALLTGFPRSGTTLLEQVLDAHP